MYFLIFNYLLFYMTWKVLSTYLIFANIRSIKGIINNKKVSYSYQLCAPGMIFATKLFNNLSNEDLITIAEAGELDSFCKALTLDLVTYNKEVETYKA